MQIVILTTESLAIKLMLTDFLTLKQTLILKLLPTKNSWKKLILKKKSADDKNAGEKPGDKELKDSIESYVLNSWTISWFTKKGLINTGEWGRKCFQITCIHCENKCKLTPKELSALTFLLQHF